MAVVMSAAPAVAGEPWIVRPVDLSGTQPHVLLRPTGEVVVAYTQSDLTAATGVGHVAALAPGARLLDRQTLPMPARVASFDVDRFGSIACVARPALPGALVVGQELPAPGAGFVAGVHPAPRTVLDPFLRPTLAFDATGVPHIAAGGTTGGLGLSSFDVPTGTWQTVTHPVPAAGAPVLTQPGLVFDALNRAVVTAVRPGADVAFMMVAREGQGGLGVLADAAVDAGGGFALAADAGGGIGVAYVDPAGVITFGWTDVNEPWLWHAEAIGTAPRALIDHGGLAFDSGGIPTLAWGDRDGGGPLHLSRRVAPGVWDDTLLPLDAWSAALRFDAADRAVLAAMHPNQGADLPGVSLVSRHLGTLARGDFALDDDLATAADVDGFVQALRHETDYLASNPGAIDADLLALGDFSGDALFDDADAQRFLDGLADAGVPGLPTRRAGHAAFDTADGDPLLGGGAANFFSTMLATPAPYRPGDSVGDLSGGPGGLTGLPDGVVGLGDIDYLVGQFERPDADRRADLDGDGVVDWVDATVLVEDVLRTRPGDLDLDGVVDQADMARMAVAFGGPGGWGDGDIDHDGLVDYGDLALLAANLRGREETGTGSGTDRPTTQTEGYSPVPVPVFSRPLTSPGAGDPSGRVPEPSTAILLCAAVVVLAGGRTRRRAGRPMRDPNPSPAGCEPKFFEVFGVFGARDETIWRADSSFLLSEASAWWVGQACRRRAAHGGWHAPHVRCVRPRQCWLSPLRPVAASAAAGFFNSCWRGCGAVLCSVGQVA